MNKAKIGAIVFLLVIVGVLVFLITSKEKARTEDLHEAMYYEVLEGKIVRCNLCPNRCILSPGQIGNCRARKNIDGKLYSLVYGKIAAKHLDPIEKKPLYHFLPGTKAYSIATTGCNLRCKFCQNWQIAQVFPWEVKTIDMTPEQVVEEALKSGAQSIAFTYTEPVVFYEFMLNTAKLAKEKGLKTVMITSGYINPEPLKNLLKYLDAVKIDFKGFSDKFYQKMTMGHVQPVLDAMKIVKESGKWLEIVNLIIPGENDSDEDIRNLALWVKENLGEDVPVHFTRFHPDYKLLNTPPTPIETLKRAREIAMEVGLKYVYTGNVYDPEGSTTYCPESREVAIKREGFFVIENNLDEEGKCPSGEKIPGVWK
ncbi:AmmeMemoRadiSam system radical SAM enzyme [bacterium]|nr:AmmeMemoRadiSam system radical SAM enzyme [bacterium]